MAAGTDSVDYSATLSSVSASGTSSLSASGLQTSLNVATAETTHTRASNAASTTTGSAATSKGSSVPIGPIVGGVVGGVAVIALFALGLVFLLRRRRRSPGPNGDPSAQNAAVNQSGDNPPQPAMQQQYQQPYFQPPADPATGYAAVATGMDNRSSIQKPGYSYNVTNSMYDPSMATSSPGSPPPQGQSPPGQGLPTYQVSNASVVTPTETTHSASQLQSTGPGVTQAHQDPSHPAYQQHSGANYYEMSTDAADRELRELA